MSKPSPARLEAAIAELRCFICAIEAPRPAPARRRLLRLHWPRSPKDAAPRPTAGAH